MADLEPIRLMLAAAALAIAPAVRLYQRFLTVWFESSHYTRHAWFVAQNAVSATTIHELYYLATSKCYSIPAGVIHAALEGAAGTCAVSGIVSSS